MPIPILSIASTGSLFREPELDGSSRRFPTDDASMGDAYFPNAYSDHQPQSQILLRTKLAVSREFRQRSAALAPNSWVPIGIFDRIAAATRTS
jgi:hypothetical protein